jgi:hypothetical protein
MHAHLPHGIIVGDYYTLIVCHTWHASDLQSLHGAHTFERGKHNQHLLLSPGSLLSRNSIKGEMGFGECSPQGVVCLTVEPSKLSN